MAKPPGAGLQSQARLDALRQAKLRALVQDRWGSGRAPASPFPGGAVLRDKDIGWVLLEDGSLGAGLVWAARHDIGELHVLVQGDAGAIARRAAEFSAPPTVWQVEGRAVRPASAGPIPVTDVPASDVAAFSRVLEAHGVDPVIDDGHLVGEVLGLEVARVESTPDGPRLSVGVGANDRWARQALFPDQDPGAALDQVVALVRERRVAGAPRHPANSLARDRWLRSAIVFRPHVVGAVRLRPFGAGAVGQTADGEPLVVGCSIGVDLDLVPSAADLRLQAGSPDARLVLVVPEGDDYPITRELAKALRHPASVMTVGRDWPALLD